MEKYEIIDVNSDRWVRSSSGLLGGVCQGIAGALQMDVWLVRALMIAVTLVGGTGLVIYLILLFALPREDRLNRAYERRLMGVCANLARRSGMEVGLVRSLFLLSAIVSFGVTLVGYLILYFLIESKMSNSGQDQIN